MPAPRGLNPDPYALLGVGADASRADIARAYRRIARALHPDSHPADPAAAERFHAVTLAYELLSDPARRIAHDQGLRGPAMDSASPVASHAGRAVPPVWPLDRALAEPGLVEPALVTPRPPIWAGPIIIESSPTRPSDDLAELADLARKFLGWTGRPW
jgi:curved DNA-binding protein CbpA